MLTPLSRMRPWKLASESATLDNLSNGRVIISVGLGALETGFEAFGEVTDPRPAPSCSTKGWIS
jgi:alkanesulfonate monooxygenase SsuD/methylene tetrahydromethanopterin reductase-like flavin-dependent oxidoreductase (luciferase family)